METEMLLSAMSDVQKIKRTNSVDPDFQLLIAHLDHELWNELQEDQATYDQYNKVPDIQTALVLYINEKPAAIGCFKKYNDDTAEVKRMFVEKAFRGKGLSKLILKELENWAMESGLRYTILETSIHFKTARTLYTNAGYQIIDNYDQYQGLEESVCMKKQLNVHPSPFRSLPDIEYFEFEEDFVEKNMRCIPMIIRFKMDIAGVKLKLSEWSQFNLEERIELAKKNCGNEEQARQYNAYLTGLIKKYTGHEPTVLNIDNNPGWADVNKLPDVLNEKLTQYGWSISVNDWRGLTILQRFALVKLCREKHVNKNFPKAMKEFNLINQH